MNTIMISSKPLSGSRSRFTHQFRYFSPAAMLVLILSFQLLISGCDHGEQHIADHEHGVVELTISCNEEARAEFTTGLGHLHHMMYDQARPHFAAAAEADANCAMAHWGIAMTSFQPLWAPTSDSDMERGKAALQQARAVGTDVQLESDLISTAEAFFTDPDPPAADRPSDHQARLYSWLNSLTELRETYPDEVEVAAFYALAEISYAMTHFSPHREREFDRELRAGALMEEFLAEYPEHPGLFHYLIHAYDSSELAHMAESVARQYDQLAPDTPHALHMPSHIFVRLGYWDDTADWNERSAEAALRNPHNGMTSLHYPHALDYMMYAYLQLEEYEKASETLERVRAIEAGQPHFATAYGIAAPQARYYLEQKMWEQAAQLDPYNPAAIDWDLYPGATALFYYARGLGAARSGDLEQAQHEQEKIELAVSNMRDAGNVYWAYMTDALGKAVEAWILYEQGETNDALALISEAADLEESMDKHPISPGEVYPVRELQAEMLYMEGQLDEARAAYEKSLERTPNRRNALQGLEEAVAGL
jgi:tetratricopeptide (TPR) repeat protein